MNGEKEAWSSYISGQFSALEGPDYHTSNVDYILKEIGLLKVWSRKIVHSSPECLLIAISRGKGGGMGPMLTLGKRVEPLGTRALSIFNMESVWN